MQGASRNLGGRRRKTGANLNVFELPRKTTRGAVTDTSLSHVHLSERFYTHAKFSYVQCRRCICSEDELYHIAICKGLVPIF